MKTLLRTLAAFLTTFISGTILAMAMNPFIAESFNGMIRTKEQGPFMPGLLLGYLMLGLFLAVYYPKVKQPNESWARSGAVFGLSVGALAFLADHLVVAGWSTMPSGPMILSGCVDSLAGLVGGLVVAFMGRKDT